MDFMMDGMLYLCFILTSFVIADEIGSEKTLTCENKNVGSPYCLWQKQGYDRHFHDLPRNESKYFQQYTTQMTIKKLTSSDSGTYRCRFFWKSKQTRYSADIRLYVVDKHTNLTLTCKDMKHGTVYIWEKLTPRYELKNNKTLILENIQYRDAGTYRCKYYWPGQDPWYYGNNTVIVVKDMTLPQLSIPNTMMLAAIGSDVVLTCIVVQTRPQTRHVWWTKLNDERQINVSDLNLHKYQGGTLQNPSLKVLDVTLNDSAEYRCYGRNTNGNNYAAMQLITGYPPVVNIKQDCYVLRVGDNVTIDVVVKHAPLGSNWIQGDYIIHNSYRQTIGQVSNPFLTIRYVELRDAGNYTLFVRNKYGKHSKVTVLKVISATIKGYKSYRKLEKKANDSFTIECEVSGGNTVTWRQNGKQLKGVNQLSLQINKLSRVNKGNYTCETNLETVTARSSILHLDVKDIPLVTTTRTKVEVYKGVDTVLSCSHDSNPTPTHVYWTKNGVNIPVFSSTKYNGSTIEFPSLSIHDTGTSDCGTYICSVSNKLGIGYSKPLQLVIRDTPSSERKEYAFKTPLIITLSVIGIILVFVGLMVCYKRRQRNISHYESPDFKQGDVHRYSTARNADEYDLPIHTDDNNTLGTMGSLDDRNEPKETRSFMVSEFLQLFNEKDKYTRHVQLEFKNLSESDNPYQSGSEYYNYTTSLMKHTNPNDKSTYLNTALTIQKRCTFLMSAIPQSDSIDQFWEFVKKNGVEHIILLTKENQQVSEFYPGSHKPIEMNQFKLELDSSEKKNQNIFVFHLQLTNKKTKSSTSVKIYETTNWKEEDKHLPLEVLSQLLDVTRLSKSKPSLLITNDELDICMILKVCADVFRAIGESTGFSVFQLAKEARSQHPRIFQEITDYELCYLLIQHHLESNHLYDAID